MTFVCQHVAFARGARWVTPSVRQKIDDVNQQETTEGYGLELAIKQRENQTSKLLNYYHLPLVFFLPQPAILSINQFTASRTVD